jgi:hypothetical protein
MGSWPTDSKLRCIQMIVRRQTYDTSVEQRRTEEDEKYGAILAVRGREEEQKKQMRTAEDAEPRKEGERLHGEEQVRVFRFARHKY